MTKIKVLLTYLVYPLAMATYFKKALEHREDVDLKVAGIYTGSWIPWNNGMNLPEKYAIPLDSIAAHKDFSNQTNCPGKNLYPFIQNGTVKKKAAEIIAAAK